jgi:hypothetical protein
VIAVARGSRLIVGEWVTRVFDAPGMQTMADMLPEASRYCTDGSEVYPEVIWPDAAWHHISIAKEETYTIEGINADLNDWHPISLCLFPIRSAMRSLRKLCAVTNIGLTQLSAEAKSG